MGDVPVVMVGAALAVLAGVVPVRRAVARARAAGHDAGFRTGWDDGYRGGLEAGRREMESEFLRYRERAQLALRAVQCAGGDVRAVQASAPIRGAP